MAALRLAAGPLVSALCRAVDSARREATPERAVSAIPLAGILAKAVLPPLRAAKETADPAVPEPSLISSALAAGVAVLRDYLQALAPVLPRLPSKVALPARFSAAMGAAVAAVGAGHSIALMASPASVSVRLSLVLGGLRCISRPAAQVWAIETLVAVLVDVRGCTAAAADPGAPGGALEDVAAVIRLMQECFEVNSIFKLVIDAGDSAEVMRVSGAMELSGWCRPKPTAHLFQSPALFQLVVELCRTPPPQLATRLPRGGVMLRAADVDFLWGAVRCADRAAVGTLQSLLGAVAVGCRASGDGGRREPAELLLHLLRLIAGVAVRPESFAEGAVALAAVIDRVVSQTPGGPDTPTLHTSALLVDVALAQAALDILSHPLAPTLDFVDSDSTSPVAGASGAAAQPSGQANDGSAPTSTGGDGASTYVGLSAPPTVATSLAVYPAPPVPGAVASLLAPLWGRAGAFFDKTAAVQAALSSIEKSTAALLRGTSGAALTAWVAVQVRVMSWTMIRNAGHAGNHNPNSSFTVRVSCGHYWSDTRAPRSLWCPSTHHRAACRCSSGRAHVGHECAFTHSPLCSAC